MCRSEGMFTYRGLWLEVVLNKLPNDTRAVLGKLHAPGIAIVQEMTVRTDFDVGYIGVGWSQWL